MDSREVIDFAKTHGWIVGRTQIGHYQFRHRTGRGKIIFTSGTPSDWRSWKNCLAEIKREEKIMALDIEERTDERAAPNMQKAIRKAIIEEARPYEHHGVIVAFHQGEDEVVVDVCFRGIKRRVFYSTSSTSSKALANAVGDVRRVLKNLGVPPPNYGDGKSNGTGNGAIGDLGRVILDAARAKTEPPPVPIEAKPKAQEPKERPMPVVKFPEHQPAETAYNSSEPASHRFNRLTRRQVSQATIMYTQYGKVIDGTYVFDKGCSDEGVRAIVNPKVDLAGFIAIRRENFGKTAAEQIKPPREGSIGALTLRVADLETRLAKLEAALA